MAKPNKTPADHRNIEAEEYLACSFLIHGLQAPIELVHAASASDFYDPLIAELWELMVDAYSNGYDLFSDPAKMRATLRAKPERESPLMELYNKLLTDERTGTDWKFYAAEVKQCKAKRDAANAVTQLQLALFEKSDTASLAELAENTAAILSKPTDERRLPTVGELIVHAAKDTEKGSVPLIPTGIDELDTELGGGIERGEIVVIGGIESHGKTALAMHLIHFWSTFGVNGLFISIEMPRELIGRRTLRYHSDVDPRDWCFSPAKVIEDAKDYGRRPGVCFVADDIDHIYGVTKEIEWQIRRNKCKFIVVDYIQLLQGPCRSTIENIRCFMQCFIRLKKKYRITTVLLSQVNKEMRNRKSFWPRNEDLAESAEIRRGADVIMFTVIPGMLDNQTPKNVMNIYVTKNRDRGVRGNVVECRLDGVHQRITSKPITEAVNYEPSFDSYYENEG